MANADILWELATGVESVQDTMRVIMEMIMDEVTMNELNSREATLRAQERIIVLGNSGQTQLAKLESLATKIMEARNA